jgi:AcrR family transcriptional regulator
MAPSRVPRPGRKEKGRYHHGDLRKALLEEAVRTIRAGGVEGLTLRGIGKTLGVSRTALYRHFADKSALLAAVGTEGFRRLRLDTLQAWERGGGGFPGLQAMGMAYVRFAVSNPSHYKVMFGGFLKAQEMDPELSAEGFGAFQVLVEALATMRREGVVRRDDPLALAHFVWGAVHGVSMLVIDGLLSRKPADVERLSRFVAERIRTGIAAAP